VRFLVLSLLVVWFGPQFVQFAGDLLHQHARWVVAGVGAAIAIGLLVWWKKKTGTSNGEPVGTPVAGK